MPLGHFRRKHSKYIRVFLLAEPVCEECAEILDACRHHLCAERASFQEKSSPFVSLCASAGCVSARVRRRAFTSRIRARLSISAACPTEPLPRWADAEASSRSLRHLTLTPVPLPSRVEINAAFAFVRARTSLSSHWAVSPSHCRIASGWRQTSCVGNIQRRVHGNDGILSEVGRRLTRVSWLNEGEVWDKSSCGEE